MSSLQILKDLVGVLVTLLDGGFQQIDDGDLVRRVLIGHIENGKPRHRRGLAAIGGDPVEPLGFVPVHRLAKHPLVVGETDIERRLGVAVLRRQQVMAEADIGVGRYSAPWI